MINQRRCWVAVKDYRDYDEKISNVKSSVERKDG